MSPTRDTTAEQMLSAQYVAPYNAQRSAIWHKLIWLRLSLHVTNSIVAFPLRKFVSPQEDMMFWQLIVNNCGDAVLLHLHSLVNDTDPKNLSLRRFANAVLGWLLPEYKDWYRERLRGARFDVHHDAVAKRIDVVRDKHIAHLEWDPLGTEPSAKKPAIAEKDVERLYKAVGQLFRTTCLTEEHVIDVNDYRAGPPEPRVIDRMLDLVAKNSYYVTRPERRGIWWPGDREHMDPHALEELNGWRTRYGLPHA